MMPPTHARNPVSERIPSGWVSTGPSDGICYSCEGPTLVKTIMDFHSISPVSTLARQDVSGLDTGICDWRCRLKELALRGLDAGNNCAGILTE